MPTFNSTDADEDIQLISLGLGATDLGFDS